MPKTYTIGDEGVTHSHPDDFGDVYVCEVDCPHCKTANPFTVPNSHDGQLIHFECKNCGERSAVDGWDPAERALVGTRAVVPCANCGAPVTLESDQAVCGACGVRNVVELKVAGEGGRAKDRAAPKGGQ